MSFLLGWNRQIAPESAAQETVKTDNEPEKAEKRHGEGSVAPLMEAGGSRGDSLEDRRDATSFSEGESSGGELTTWRTAYSSEGREASVSSSSPSPTVRETRRASILSSFEGEPQQVNDFSIIRRIGCGAFSEVFLARHCPSPTQEEGAVHQEERVREEERDAETEGENRDRETEGDGKGEDASTKEGVTIERAAMRVDDEAEHQTDRAEEATDPTRQETPEIVQRGRRSQLGEEGEEVAIKVMTRSFLKRRMEFRRSRTDGRVIASSAASTVEREIAILKKISHRNIVRLFEVIDDPTSDKLFLIMEFAPGGQLMTWCPQSQRYQRREKRAGETPVFTERQEKERDTLAAEGHKEELMTEEEAAGVVRDVVCGLEYLHANGIAHKDLKPENILLTEEERRTAKIADFSLACWVREEAEEDGRRKGGETHSAGGRQGDEREGGGGGGTLHFLPPEAVKGGYDFCLADIWALGATLLVMLTGRPPFLYEEDKESPSLDCLLERMTKGEVHIPSSVSPLCQSLLQGMLHRDPSQRFSLRDVRQHSWLQIGLSSPVSTLSPSLFPATPPPLLPLVEVSEEELSNAITVRNNFALMAQLKLHFRFRLGRMRSSLSLRKASSDLLSLSSRDLSSCRSEDVRRIEGREMEIARQSSLSSARV